MRFRVERIDGKAQGENHGVDTDAQGNGVITEHRLYQLVRQKGAIDRFRTFEIEFLDAGGAGVRVYVWLSRGWRTRFLPGKRFRGMGLHRRNLPV